MIPFKFWPAALAALLVSAAAWAQEISIPTVKCIALTATVIDADTKPQWDIAATNRCGKDITAYSLVVSDLGQIARSATDFTRFLEISLTPSDDPYWITDLWRAGATLRLKRSPLNNPVTTTGWVAIDAVLFADRSSAGDPEQISRLIQLRRNDLAMYQGFRESWAHFLECPDGFGCLERALTARKNERPSPDIFEKGKLPGGILDDAARELGSHPERWREYVQERIRVLDATILLFKQQLEIKQSSRE